MHVAAGVPRVLSALALAFNTNLFGALTHYSSGQAAVYFGGKFMFYFSGFHFIIFIYKRVTLKKKSRGSKNNML